MSTVVVDLHVQGISLATEESTVTPQAKYDEFTCRIVTYAEELGSIYFWYSIGDWFNTPMSGFITSTCVQYVL